jgi:anhydro-N-acetylmuramic acid kinase
MTMLTAIGLMSGTSMDGVDIALLKTDGEAWVERGAFASYAYGDADRALLRQALSDAVAMRARDERPGVLSQAEALVTERHAQAVKSFLATHGLEAGSIDLIGFHGQTVLHRPQERLTVQIGDGAALARATGIRTIYDLRAADVAAGGQGAPLVPVYHRALVAASGLAGPVAVVNIGGVANVTFIGSASGEPVAFDTGPGNALIDDLMLERTGVAVDRDGETAATGVVSEAILADMLAHPFFAKPFPKSLDRNDFSRAAVSGLSTADAAATLTAFTARSIGLALQSLPAQPRLLIVCGGGARNPTLLRALRQLPCEVKTADDLGWSADAMEAEAFAYLAVRSLKGLPITFPGTTGVLAPMTGGVATS